MQFAHHLTEIFDNGAEAPRIADPADERALIARAQLGEEDATIALLYSYAPALRSALRSFTPEQRASEDVRMGVVLGVLEAVRAFDGTKAARLAGIVRDYVSLEALDSSDTGTALTVPPRTLRRFFAILRNADGNVYEAAALAPLYEMTKETFFAVLSAVRGVDSLDETLEAEGAGGLPRWETVQGRPVYWTGEHEDADDAVLVAAAFLAVDDVEEEVCRTFFAFDDPYRDANRSDAETAGLLGMTRPTVQRTRARALGKMRVAIAATEEA